MLSNRALAVVVAVLSGTGADIKKLEDGQTAVNMYLFISIGRLVKVRRNLFQAFGRDTSTSERS